MTDSKVVESHRNSGSCEQRLADQNDQRGNEELTNVMNSKEGVSLRLRNADQEESWTEDEKQEKEEDRYANTEDEEKETSDGEEEERVVGKDDEEEQEREAEEEEEKEDVRHKYPNEDTNEDREVQSREDEGVDKVEDTDNDDNDTEDSDDYDSDTHDDDKGNYKNDEDKGNDNDDVDIVKSFTDREKENDDKRAKKGKGDKRGYCIDADNVSEMAPCQGARGDIGFGGKMGVPDSDSDAASSSRSKDGSPVATPQRQILSGEVVDASRGRSETEMDRDERRSQKTDCQGEDGSERRATEDVKDTEDAEGNEKDGDDSEDAEDAAEDENNEEEGDGGEDDRVLVERGGKFSFLSLRELTSQEKKLYGLVPSDSVPALASTPKLHPMTRRSDKRPMGLPLLLGAKRGGKSADTAVAIGSRARNRATASDTAVVKTSGKRAENTGGNISTTTTTTTVRTVQRRRSEKTSSCPTVSLTDRRKSGSTSTPAGPPKSQTDGKTRTQEVKPRCTRSAGGDVEPEIEPGMLYRSPYTFSPERRRELSRILKDRVRIEKAAEEAKRLEEECRRKEAEQAFTIWMESKRRQTLTKEEEESYPKLSKQLIEATQRDAAEAAFDEWLRMKRRQRMDEMRRREEERQKYLMALENALADRKKAETAYKRWVRKKQKTSLPKKRRMGAAAAGATSNRHHVTARGKMMLAAAATRREPVQRPPRGLLRKTSSSSAQFPSQSLSLATAANYFRLLYCM